MADPKQLDILVSQSQSGVALRFDIYEVGGTACWWFEASPELVKQFVADALRTQPALSEHESTKPPLLTPGGRDLRAQHESPLNETFSAGSPHPTPTKEEMR